MKQKILIIGMGPVGLSTAIGFAHVGVPVVCYDIDKRRIDKLKKGEAPFYEGGLQQYLTQYTASLTFTDSAEVAFQDTNVFFIAVGTPLGKNSSADMSAFWSVIEQIEANIRRDSIIVVKSTVPIGTNEQVIKYFARRNLPYRIEVVSNPEFLAQGTSIDDTLNATRIVIGCNNEESKVAMQKIYDKFSCEKIITTPKSAELIKYAANCYLAMRISYVNDLAVMCGLIGADVQSVLRGVALDPRIGEQYFSPSLGYGGSCFPKDTVCFHNQMQSEYGHELELIEATVDINKRQSLLLCRKIIEDNGDLFNKNICVLGLSFKQGTDDVRNSLSVDNITFLISNGANVTVWDPIAMQNGKDIFGNRITYADNIESAVNQCDIVLIATDWNAIVNAPLCLFKGKHVYDGRNCLLSRIDEIEFEYTYIGGVKKNG